MCTAWSEVGCGCAPHTQKLVGKNVLEKFCHSKGIRETFPSFQGGLSKMYKGSALA